MRPPVERDRAGEEGRRTLSGGQALIARLAWAFVREGGTVLTGHRMERLVVEGDRVVGVEAVTAEGRATVRADRGVLVAAGGFEHDPQMRQEHGVPGASEWSMAPAGTNTGEPIRAAAAIGAATDLMHEGWFCPGVEQPDGSGSFTLGFRGGLIVDRSGARYANESLPYDRFGREMAKSADRVPSWFVFDSREGGRLPAIGMPEGDPRGPPRGRHLGPRRHRRRAGRAAADAAAAESVERFNGYAAGGVDEEFGRGADEYDTFFAFTGQDPNKALLPVDQPPFFAARMVLSDLGTKGGLVTDPAGRVLREDGSAIPGLYASSNSAASMAGAAYPGPGVPLGTAMVFASLAVQDLLAR